jgi:hypothetical protein
MKLQENYFINLIQNILYHHILNKIFDEGIKTIKF